MKKTMGRIITYIVFGKHKGEGKERKGGVKRKGKGR